MEMLILSFPRVSGDRPATVHPSRCVETERYRTACTPFNLDGNKGKALEMLILKPRSKDGRKVAGRLPLYRVRHRKYGLIVHEQVLKRTVDIAIFGPHGAGKSRWLAKLSGGAAEVWPGRPAAMLRAVEPLANWTEQPTVEAWQFPPRERG